MNRGEESAAEAVPEASAAERWPEDRYSLQKAAPAAFAKGYGGPGQRKRSSGPTSTGLDTQGQRSVLSDLRGAQVTETEMARSSATTVRPTPVVRGRREVVRIAQMYEAPEGEPTRKTDRLARINRPFSIHSDVCVRIKSSMHLTTLRQLPGHPFRAVPRLSRVTAAILLTTVMTMVFALDRLTGVPHVQHLYYFPIILAGVMLGIPGGAVAAATAIVLYHLAHPHALSWRYEEADVVQMGVFVAVGFVAARLANDARKLHRLAMTDDLTGLHNLRSFELALQGMMRVARTARTPLSLLVLDVDRLKSINDQHGHLAGAEAVRMVGHLIAALIPANGVACRYGGDEFVVALPCPEVNAREVADQLRLTVLAQAPVLAGVKFPQRSLSVSVGLASRPQDDERTTARPDADGNEEAEALFRAADSALYVAKNGGRNRVHAAVLPSHFRSAHSPASRSVTCTRR